MAIKTSLAHELTKFEAVFCSGFFIPDPAIVTALSLLFERVYFLNHLEFVLEFSRQFKFKIPEDAEIPEVALTPIGHSEDNPFSSLTPDQRKTAETYLYLADRFFVRYAQLFPEIFHCSLLPKGEVLSVELLKEKVDGKKNLYRVTRNPLMVGMGGVDELNRYIAEGKVPILSHAFAKKRTPVRSSPKATQIAALLALQSVVMVLPRTKAVEPEIILEARAKLKDHLPPFWSSMLKLSVELKERLGERVSPERLQQECDYAVSTTVKPALIDLVGKLERERKQWFHKILSPVSTGLGVLAGKPPVSPLELIATSLKLGADITIDVSNQIQKVEAMKREIGLTYLIELHKTLSSKSKPEQTD